MFVGSILSFSRGGREKEGLPNGFHSLPLPGKEEQQTGKPNSQSGRQDKQQEIQVILDLVPILFTISSNTPQLQTFLSPAKAQNHFPPERNLYTSNCKSASPNCIALQWTALFCGAVVGDGCRSKWWPPPN